MVLAAWADLGMVGWEGWSAMTETLVGVSPAKRAAGKSVPPGEAERAAVRELVKAARARGESITGPDGLLKTITATVLESALEEEMTEHLGHEKNRASVDSEAAGGAGNIRNGHRPKTVLTDAAGEVSVQVPGPGRLVRAGDRQEAAAAVVRCGCGGDLVVRQGVDHW